MHDYFHVYKGILLRIDTFKFIEKRHIKFKETYLKLKMKHDNTLEILNNHHTYIRTNYSFELNNFARVNKILNINLFNAYPKIKKDMERYEQLKQRERDIFKKLNLYLGSNHLIIEEMRNVITNADKILSQLLKENIEPSDFIKKQMLIDNSREQLCKKLYEKWLRTNKGNNQYEFIKSFDNETYKNTRRSSWLLNKFLSYVENVQYLEKKNIK